MMFSYQQQQQQESPNNKRESFYESAREFDFTWNDDDSDDDNSIGTNDERTDHDDLDDYISLSSETDLSPTKTIVNLGTTFHQSKHEISSCCLLLEPEDDVEEFHNSRRRSSGYSDIDNDMLTYTSISDAIDNTEFNSCLLLVSSALLFGADNVTVNNNHKIIEEEEEEEEVATEENTTVADMSSSSSEDDDDDDDDEEEETDWKYGTSFTRTLHDDDNNINDSALTSSLTSSHHSHRRISEKAFHLLLSHHHNCNNETIDTNHNNSVVDSNDKDSMSSQPNMKKCFQFGIVHIREYSITVGAADDIVADSCSSPYANDEEEDEDDATNNVMSSSTDCPIELDWEHSDTEYITTLSEYESYQNKKRRFEMRLSGITAFSLSYDDNTTSNTIQYDCNDVRRLSLQERRQRIASINGISVEDVYRIEQERKIISFEI